MTWTTPLGRPVDNGTDFQGDVALKILYDFYNGFDDERYPLTTNALYLGSAMGQDEAREVALHLAGLGYVSVDGEIVRMTATGMAFVRKCIDEMACPQCGHRT
jgi:hypothetical protein